MRKGGTVHLYHWFACALRVAVNEPREHFLADTGFAQDQNRNIGARDLCGEVPDLPHLFTVGNEHRNIRIRLVCVFGTWRRARVTLLLLLCRLDSFEKIRRIDRRIQRVRRTKFQRLNHDPDLIWSNKDHNRYGRNHSSCRDQKIQARCPRLDNTQDDGCGTLIRAEFDRFLGDILNKIALRRKYRGKL